MILNEYDNMKICMWFRMNKHIQDKKNETQPVRNNTTHPPKNNTTHPPKNNTTHPPKNNTTHPPKNNTTHPPKNNTTHPPNYEKIDSLSKVMNSPLSDSLVKLMKESLLVCLHGTTKTNNQSSSNINCIVWVSEGDSETVNSNLHRK
ncbi:hypothetical protein KSF78_0002032 [Schistosoma japonicum]|nr:hypothetical protein KSF78_0002032 [Schistosoma japonicum]